MVQRHARRTRERGPARGQRLTPAPAMKRKPSTPAKAKPDPASETHFVTIEVKETADAWTGEVWRDADRAGAPLLRFILPRAQAAESGRPWAGVDACGRPNMPGPAETAAAQLWPNAVGTASIRARTFADFREAFLERASGACLDLTSRWGLPVLPANFQAEIITPDFLKRLVRRLGKPDPDGTLKFFLARHWQSMSLGSLTARELATLLYLGQENLPAAPAELAFVANFVKALPQADRLRLAELWAQRLQPKSPAALQRFHQRLGLFSQRAGPGPRASDE